MIVKQIRVTNPENQNSKYREVSEADAEEIRMRAERKGMLYEELRERDL